MSKKDRLELPYYQIARNILIDKKGMTEEEANNFIKTNSFRKIERLVKAKKQVDCAVEYIYNYMASRARYYGEIEYNEEAFGDFVYSVNGSADNTIGALKEEADYAYGRNGKDGNLFPKTKERLNNLVMGTLFALHDNWVTNNSQKFYQSDRKERFMPSELIGWENLKEFLVYVKPIYEAAGVPIIEEELEKTYNYKVQEFFLDHDIQSARNLSDSYTQGEYFYPPLAGYGEILTIINDPAYVDKNIIPAVEQYGIGNIQEVRQKILSQIIENPKEADVERLSPEEKENVEQAVGKENIKPNISIESLKKLYDLEKAEVEMDRKLKAQKKEKRKEELMKKFHIDEDEFEKRYGDYDDDEYDDEYDDEWGDDLYDFYEEDESLESVFPNFERQYSSLEEYLEDIEIGNIPYRGYYTAIRCSGAKFIDFDGNGNNNVENFLYNDGIAFYDILDGLEGMGRDASAYGFKIDELPKELLKSEYFIQGYFAGMWSSESISENLCYMDCIDKNGDELKPIKYIKELKRREEISLKPEDTLKVGLKIQGIDAVEVSKVDKVHQEAREQPKEEGRTDD